jgi:DNA polymerase IV
VSTSARYVPIASANRWGPNTFFTDLFALGEARDALQPIIAKVWHHCEAMSTWGRTVTLKVKYADFHQITRSVTCDAPVATQAALEQVSYALLEPVFPVQQGIRLLGVTISSLGGDPLQNAGQLKLSL